jgi:hypothetical protein
MMEDEFSDDNIIHRLRCLTMGKAWLIEGESRAPIVEIAHKAANEIERLRALVKE